jgi:hypothetical protein
MQLTLSSTSAAEQSPAMKTARLHFTGNRVCWGVPGLLLHNLVFGGHFKSSSGLIYWSEFGDSGESALECMLLYRLGVAA